MILGKKRYNKGKILNDLRKVFIEKNNDVVKLDLYNCYEKNILLNPRTIKRIFGSVDNACALIGKKLKTRVQIRDEKILKKLKELFKQNKKLYKSDLTKLCIERKINFSAETLRVHFGSADKAAELISEKFYTNKLKKEDILDNLKKVLKKKKIMTKNELYRYRKKNGKLCHLTTIRNKFGSLDEAANLVGFKFLNKREVGKVRFNNRFYSFINNVKKPTRGEFVKMVGDTNALQKYMDGKTLDKIAEEYNINFIKKERINNVCCKGKFFGNNERKILDIVEKENNIKLERQKRIGRFFVDGYDSDNNVVYEVDEIYHRKGFQKIYDFEREQKIKAILDCKIIRIDEEIFLKGINNMNLNKIEGGI